MADPTEVDGSDGEATRLVPRDAPAADELVWRWEVGDPVQTKRGALWRGYVVGTYTTKLTPEGYVIESAYEKGSVHVYPASHLCDWGESAKPPK